MSNISDGTTTTAAMETGSAVARSSGGLLKVLGVWFGVAAAVGNAIAAGIVRAPGDIATWLPSAPLFLGVWALGGLYALVSAPSMAELGACIPRSGGQYNFSRRALGDYPGFIVGWSDWLSSAGTSAAVAIVIGEYSGALFPELAGHVRLIAVSVVLGFFLLQYNGVRWGSSTQLVTSALKTVAFVVLVGACFVFGGNGSAHAPIAAPVAAGNAAPPVELHFGWPLLIGFTLALQAVIYTIDGWDGIIYFGEEIRDPGRDVPRAIYGGVFSVMGIYLLINAAVLYFFPIEQIAGNNFALGTVANLLFGRFGDPIIRTVMLISLASCINATQLFCSRTLYAMSADRLFFRFGARVNAGGTPTVALLLSTIVAITFILGTFERVIAMLSFFFVANYTLSYWSLFVLRKKEPLLPRPYRAWGYPYTTALALIGSILFLVGSIITDRHNAPLALLLLVASYPIFLLVKYAGRERSKEATT